MDPSETDRQTARSVRHAGADQEMTSRRRERLISCVARRVGGVVVVLENIEDLGNRAAILRTIEALGFLRVHEVGPPASHASGAARSIMNGGEKFLEIQRWPSAADCAAALRAAGVGKILVALPPEDRGERGGCDISDEGCGGRASDIKLADSSSPSSKARGKRLRSQRLDDVDFSHDTALVFGNERLGVSAEAIAAATGSFHVPMFGEFSCHFAPPALRRCPRFRSLRTSRSLRVAQRQCHSCYCACCCPR